MSRTIVLRKTGESVRITLPRAMVERLGLAVGDRVLAMDTVEGILLTPYTKNLAADLAASRRASKRYRTALRDLAD